MYANAIAVSVLLLAAGIDSRDAPVVAPVAAAGTSADAWIQLAAGGKLGEKYMAGRAGGRYGIGGPEAEKKKRSKKSK
jgi:hypothetical protein